MGGWLIMNTYGASKGNPGPAGAGGVLRGDKGEWLIGFSESLGVCSSVKAEIRTVLRGFKIAQEAQVQKLWLQTDSKVVVSMLTSSNDWHLEHSFLLHQCKQLIDWEGWEVKISHCFREAN